MKRLVVRLSILSSVLALGLIAIAQARHGLPGLSGEEPAKPQVELPESAPGPVSADPFDPSAFRSKRPAASDSPDDAVPELPSRLGPPVRRQGETSAAVVLASREEDEDEAPASGSRFGSSPDRYAAPARDRSDVGQPPRRFDADPPNYGAQMPDAGQFDVPEPELDGPPARRSYGGESDTEYLAPPVPRNQDPSKALPSRPSSTASGGAAARPSLIGRNQGAQPEEPDPLPESNPLRSARSIRSAPDDMQIPDADAYDRPSAELPPLGGRNYGQSAQPAGTAGSGRPGARQLEGSQAPSLVLEKTAPQEIQVGKECKFEVFVRNVGQVPAYDVEIHDEVPHGTTLAGTVPPATGHDGALAWRIGDLQPGDEAKVEVLLIPHAEGEIGSVARVQFQAQASARAIATRPELQVRMTAPQTVMIGEDVRITIAVSNPGSGAAGGVLLLENIPEGMRHPAGSSLEFEVGTLAPGETRELELVLSAEKAGRIVNTLVARADANLEVEEAVEFEVVAPQLAVDVQGPRKRYLERPATYVVSVANPGTAPAREIELVTYLPPGMKFVRANNAGHYDQQSHSVSWGLAELPAQQSGNVELVAMPVEMGEQKLRIAGRAEQGLADEIEQTLAVEGLAAVLFTVANLHDPVEVGGETVYEIRVVNQGSKASDNVQLVAVLPPGLQATSASGPTRHSIEGNHVVFQPLARLAPKADTTYQIKLQAIEPGDQRVRVQLMTDEMRTPVTKEESTRVYADE